MPNLYTSIERAWEQSIGVKSGVHGLVARSQWNPLVCAWLACQDARAQKMYIAVWRHASRGNKSMRAHESKVMRRVSGGGTDIDDGLI